MKNEFSFLSFASLLLKKVFFFSSALNSIKNASEIFANLQRWQTKRRKICREAFASFVFISIFIIIGQFGVVLCVATWGKLHLVFLLHLSFPPMMKTASENSEGLFNIKRRCVMYKSSTPKLACVRISLEFLCCCFVFFYPSNDHCCYGLRIIKDKGS